MININKKNMFGKVKRDLQTVRPGDGRGANVIPRMKYERIETYSDQTDSRNFLKIHKYLFYYQNDTIK